MGEKSPTIATAQRLLAAAGFDLTKQPHTTFSEVKTSRGRMVVVPSTLPRRDERKAVASVVLPLHLNWSDRGRIFHLRDWRDRARVYETVLSEGTAEDIRSYIDGLLLIDLWKELVLPRDVRAAWQPLIDDIVLAA